MPGFFMNRLVSLSPRHKAQCSPSMWAQRTFAGGPVLDSNGCCMTAEIIWDFAARRNAQINGQEYDSFCDAWKAVRAELDALVDLEILYESPSVAERLHEVELPSDCEPA